MSTSESRSDNLMGAEAIDNLKDLKIDDDPKKPKKGCRDMVAEIKLIDNPEIGDLKKGIQDRDKQILKLKQEVERLLEEKEETIVTKNKEIEELKAQVKKLEAEKICVEEKNLVLEAEVKDLKDQITILKDQITTLKEQINTLEAEKVDLQKQQKDLENKHSALNEEVAELEGSNLLMGERVNDLEERVGNLKNENKDLREDVRELKKENKDLQEDVHGLKDELRIANRSLLALGEMCFQIPSLMFQKVIPQWYVKSGTYFVEDIEHGITALGKEDNKESQNVAEKSWAKLKKELNWKENYAIPLRTIRKSRTNIAHPKINEELLRKAAKEAKKSGDLSIYTYNSIVELIGIWVKLNLGN